MSPKLNGPLGGEMQVLPKEQWGKGYFNEFSCKLFPGNSLELKPGRFTNALHEDHGYLDIRARNVSPYAHQARDNSISFQRKSASEVRIQLRPGISEFGRMQYSPFAAGYLIYGELNANSGSPPPTNPMVRLLHVDGRVQEFVMPEEIWRLRRMHNFSVRLTKRGLLWSVNRYPIGGVPVLDEDGVLKRLALGGVVSPNGCRLVAVWSPSSGKAGAWLQVDKEHREGRRWLIVHDIC